MAALDVATATTVWLPIAAFIAGFLTKSLSDWFLHRQALEREREARREARRDRVRERATEVERETLYKLQEALADLVRTTGAAHHQDEMAFRRTGEWKKQLLDEELNQKSFAAVRETQIQRNRLRDTSLRDMVQRLIKHSGSIELSRSLESSDAELLRMMDTYEKAQDKINERFRALDDEEALV